MSGALEGIVAAFLMSCIFLIGTVVAALYDGGCV